MLMSRKWHLMSTSEYYGPFSLTCKLYELYHGTVRQPPSIISTSAIVAGNHQTAPARPVAGPIFGASISPFSLITGRLGETTALILENIIMLSNKRCQHLLLCDVHSVQQGSSFKR
jgi:hypothetical protein